MIWTQPKQIAPVQNNWHSTKMVWTVQNHFGPIEGQGIRKLFFHECFFEQKYIIKIFDWNQKLPKVFDNILRKLAYE